MTTRPVRHPKGRSQKSAPAPLPPIPHVNVTARCIGCSFEKTFTSGELQTTHPTCPHCGQPMLAISANTAAR